VQTAVSDVVDDRKKGSAALTRGDERRHFESRGAISELSENGLGVR
jgi:hypothetical protein